MATGPDQNLSDAASSLGRSSSIDARDGALPRSDSQRRSASKVGRKGGRSGNDLFVCFAPLTTLNLVSANRPVVSPARDKGKEAGGSARRSGRTLSSSIFSSKGAPKKQGYDAAEEPTSPKVTCIGQVRSKSKNDKKNKGSPGSSRKQAEGKKESACSSFAKEFSCFGLPCDSYGSLPSFRGDKKSSGTVFAKSLVLIQREDEGKTVAAEASMMQLRAQSSPEKEKKGGEEISVMGRPGLKEEENREEISSLTPATVSVMGVRNKLEALQSKEIAEDQTSVEEDDTFEAEPPPSNALLLMRSKVEHLRVLVPPPSINITLKRSTSAPAHCRRKSEDADDGGQIHAPDDVDHTSTTEKKMAIEARRETSSVVISSEDLPKPAANASKSFLQRCKSVSRSLSRSSSEPAEEAKSSPATQDTKSGHDAYDMAAIGEDKDELHLVSEALSRRRSDSEALKVSLDIVPETWLWETRAVARQEPKEKTGSGRRLEMKQGGGAVAEWLDGELEAALWKSCQVAEARPASHSHKEPVRATEPSLHEENLTANQALDAEVEATLWRCCSLVASHPLEDQQSELKTDEFGLATGKRDLENSKFSSKTTDDSSKINEAAKVDQESVEHSTNFDKNASKQGNTAVHSGGKSSNLGRSSSVGSQSGKHVLERGFSLRRCASVGAGQQQQKFERKKKKKSAEQIREEKTENTQSPHEISAEGQACACQSDVGDVHSVGHVHDEHNVVKVRDVCDVHDVGNMGVATSEGYASSCIVEAELWCAGRPPDGRPDKTKCNNKGGLVSKFDRNEMTEKHKHTGGAEAIDADDITAPSPSSVLDRPAPPPSPAPATPPEAVLFLRYDLGAFRISLDGTAKTETQADQHHHQQQKAMLEAISHLHIHDVQRTYTRLFKAASGKERASLSSAAFRLQRCKSEPVRLASY